MNKILLKKLGLAAIIAAAVVGGGWGLGTPSGSEALARGSAILAKSWGEVFGGGATQGGAAPVALVDSSGASDSPIMAGVGSVRKKTRKKSVAVNVAKPTVALCCWGTEPAVPSVAPVQEPIPSVAADSSSLPISPPTTPIQAASASIAPISPELQASDSKNTFVSVGDPVLSVPQATATTTQSQLKQQSKSPCQFPGTLAQDASGSGPIIFNEIAWMGSVPVPGETAAKAGAREWIELKNISAKAVALDGWQVADADGKIQLVFGAGDSIPAGGLYLLSRSGNAVGGAVADRAYSGALANSGDEIAVFDAGCGVSDFVNASNASGGWPAGDNATKQTMERTANGAWQTSAAPGGTPKAENSPGLANYAVNVAIQGDGRGTVVSSPAGISCNPYCSAQFGAGTALTLSAKPGTGVVFDGWSGGCSGSSECALTVGGIVSVTATFHTSTSSDAIPPVTSPSPSPVAVSHLLIAQIQIAGAAHTNAFIKIYNPTAAAVDISHWKLRKKSRTGADYSLREFPKGASLAAGAYFIWANSTGGFAQSIGADASSSATLAANNSVALFDAAGGLVDAVAWGTGVNQYVEGSPYPTSPKAGQVLERKQGASGNGLVDTDNNALDFNLK